MTYLVLARKWRPRSFDTLIGQDHVVRALTHALTTQRLHHAWLFTGTRGVGKTTLSRILAKSLNCENGITAAPCGVCRACTEIDSGRFVDYVELDAASNRGVDEMTQLLEQAVYSPSVGRFKVYMIDEVHMLTGHAFNAMLKTLEEPPAHVKFILATTDPQKIPVTVLSRCLQFNLKQMTAEAMVGHLQMVLQQESLAFETPALRLIAQAAAGSMRDALSLTDQAIAYSAGELTTEAIQGMLGTIDQRYLVRLLMALSAGSASEVLRVADELATRGLSYAGALADLAILLSRVAIEQRIPNTVPADDPLAGDIASLAQCLHPDLVQLFYSVAVHSRGELSLAPDEYAGFVMACLRMLALAPEPVQATRTEIPQPATAPPPAAVEPKAAEAVPGKQEAAAIAPAVKKNRPVVQEPAIQARQPVEASPASEPAAAPKRTPPEPQPEPEPDTLITRSPAAGANDIPAWEDEPMAGDDTGNFERDDDVPGFGSAEPDDGTLEPVAQVVDDTAVQVFAPERKKIKSPRLQDMTPKTWPTLAAQLPLTGLAAELARQSEWLGTQNSQINLRVAVRTLAESPGKARLCTLLSEHFGSVVSLNVEYGATGDETARAVELAEQAVRQERAEQAVRVDPFIQTLVSEFGARVVPGSVRAAPINKAA